MLERIVEIINSGHSFLVASHVRPDGDAIGSILALYHALSDMGKEVVVYNRDKTPEVYRFLPASEAIVHSIDSVDAFDAVILLDCSELERVGDEAERIGAIGSIINIDHHVSNNGFSPLSLVDIKASSTGEIIYGLIEMLGVTVTKDIATSIYTAVMTDTGAFCYSNTTSDTLTLAARLVEAGANPRTIAENVYETKPLIQIKLMEKALNTLEIDLNGRIGSIVVTQEMLAELGALPEHTEGLVDLVRSIAGVDVAVFYQEMSKNNFKASLRSKRDIDIEKVAREFDGGGHINASACRLEGNIDAVKGRLAGSIMRITSD
ncbi:MAG: bifunctional oligoribonuclease/PAP phosphatase NrnA [Thermodesulfobacteriota bacterium]|nr:bifunctional oligoribonuclease/PAP phosphatase NrnA [Thermodesulfobacteriota bacterium]